MSFELGIRKDNINIPIFDTRICIMNREANVYSSLRNGNS
jgi:hypothetical protein